MLCLDQVGIHGTFLELATQIVFQILKQFQVEIPLQSLFQSPTVAEMAVVITEHRAKELSEHELQSILKDLESMSDEQARKFLSELGEARPKGEVRDE